MGGMRQSVRLQSKRINTFLQISLVAFVSLLAGCATQFPRTQEPARPVFVSAVEQEALRSLVSLQDRLYQVGAPLLVNNIELCKGNARSLLGFTAKNKYSYPAEFVEAAHQIFGMNDRLQVMGVLAGSGAAKVGIKRGDGLVAVEDKTMPQGQDAERQAAGILAPLVNGKSRVKLSLMRNGANMALNVPLTPACGFGIELGNTDSVNAYADGHRVLITRGMINFTHNDEELAYVLAREMAHNALMHAQKQRMNATVGGIIDNLVHMHPDLSTMAGMAGIKAMPQEMDTAADTLALYMVARAGYGIGHAPAFWQRLTAQYPATMLNAYNALHPSTSARMAVVESTIADIKGKQAAGKALVP